MKNPKVSICIPTYKQTRYLKGTLDSILIQDYKNYEIIITDDSLGDSVKELIQKYDFDGKLKYFKNKHRKGSPENWNEAVSKASGEYIKILHHDDKFMYKDSLREYVEMLNQNPSSDFAFSATAIHYSSDSSKNRVHKISPKELENLRKNPTSLFLGNLVGAPSATIYRKKTNNHYDKKLKWLVDIDFYIDILLINNNSIYSPRPLIGTIADADHKVTKQCIDNKKIEIFEYYYLFNKINKAIPHKQILKYLLRLWSVSSYYEIKKVTDIRNCGYNNEIPSFIFFLLFLNKISKRLPKIYIKLYKIIHYD